jgi:hypothetical protein
MTDITQSSATTATTTPDWYNNHLTGVASQGAAAAGNLVSGGNLTAAGNAAYAPNSLQTSAWDAVQGGNIGGYQSPLASAGANYAAAGNADISGAANPYLQAGTATSGLSQANPYLTAGSSSSADLVQGYMNPYTQNVVNQIGAANQQNIAQNLSPGITSGAVGAGQFGSQRGSNALALGISNANLGALGQQAGALQSGYAQALAAAQAQRQQQINAGQIAGTLQNEGNRSQITAGQIAGNTAYQDAANQIAAGTGNLNLGIQAQQAGLNDINAQATLGAQKQAVAQNQALAPFDIAAKQASLLSGANIPTTVTQTMNTSPLSAIAGLGGLGIGMLTKDTTSMLSPLDNIFNSVKTFYDDYLAAKPANAGADAAVEEAYANNPVG